MTRQRGFSLIEVLAVVALIALAGAAVTLSLPQGAPPSARAADTFTGALAEAARYSVIAGTPVGVVLDTRGYRFYEGFRGSWQPLFGNQRLAPGQWPRGVSVAVDRSGLDLSVDDDLLPDDAVLPSLRFEPMGQATPATLTFADTAGHRRTIRVEADADLALVREADDAMP